MVYGRLLFYIMAPFVGVSVYDSLDSNKSNTDKVTRLNKVAQCMDKYTYLDESQISQNLSSQKDKLEIIYYTFWIMMGFAIAELAIPLILLIAKCIDKIRPRTDRDNKAAKPTQTLAVKRNNYPTTLAESR